MMTAMQMSQHILAQAAGEHQSFIESQQAALQTVLQRVQALRGAADCAGQQSSEWQASPHAAVTA